MQGHRVARWPLTLLFIAAIQSVASMESRAAAVGSCPSAASAVTCTISGGPYDEPFFLSSPSSTVANTARFNVSTIGSGFVFWVFARGTDAPTEGSSNAAGGAPGGPIDLTNAGALQATVSPAETNPYWGLAALARGGAGGAVTAGNDDNDAGPGGAAGSVTVRNTAQIGLEGTLPVGGIALRATR
jgi:hypothetical protein